MQQQEDNLDFNPHKSLAVWGMEMINYLQFEAPREDLRRLEGIRSSGGVDWSAVAKSQGRSCRSRGREEDADRRGVEGGLCGGRGCCEHLFPPVHVGRPGDAAAAATAGASVLLCTSAGLGMR